MISYTATYSPDDNKLRLYASARLDEETYARVRAAGFIFAPKQDLFVAPAWTPEREDFLVELAGEVGDEDTSLVDRAADRAERFGVYSEKRGVDADRALEAVDRIAGGIPLGQPILVGHHSERRARRDADRIKSGLEKAVKLWDTSTYWTRRAAGAVAHAKYKELPAVRARRVKTIEADKRRAERAGAYSAKMGTLWARAHEAKGTRPDGTAADLLDRVLHLANYDQTVYGLWSELRDGKVTAEAAQASAVERHAAVVARSARVAAHCDHRVAYERAMLEAAGWTPPAKPRTAAELPLLNYAGVVRTRNPYHRGDVDAMEAHPLTKAEYAAIGSEYKGTRVSEDGTHRVRTALVGSGTGRGLTVVYLTDSKKHERPTAPTVEPLPPPSPRAPARSVRPRRAPTAREQAFEGLREQLKTGVRAVSAPQLFPTPPALADMVVAEAGIGAGARVLEPSAGTGSILRAIVEAEAAIGRGGAAPEVVAVEVNAEVASAIPRHLAARVVTADFLDLTAHEIGTFDRIVMNPPFAQGADVRHVMHAFRLLVPGGKLVAIVADGARQNSLLKPFVERMGGTWEPLGEGQFESQGTSVRTVLLTVESRS